MSVLAALLIAIIGQPEAGGGVAEGRLCGRDATNNEVLLEALRQRPSVNALQDDGEFIQLVDLEENHVWTFSTRGHSAYPAVSCSELGPHEGQLAFRQSVVCNGISQPDCEAFFAMNRMRNDRILAEMRAQ